MARRGRTFTAEFKARVVLALMRGEKSKAELVRDHRLKQSLIEEWQAEFEAKASQIFAQPGAVDPQEARIAELERHVGKLSLELEISKKASTLLNSLRTSSGRSLTNSPRSTP
jgi:transposase-like protein